MNLKCLKWNDFQFELDNESILKSIWSGDLFKMSFLGGL